MSEVEITLAGRPVVLRCTLGALKALDAAPGGLSEVISGLTSYRFASYCAVVAAGTGRRPSEVEEDIYKTGMPALVGDLAEFVGMLVNGGVKPGDEQKEPPSGNG
jgi:hypothetical protein